MNLFNYCCINNSVASKPSIDDNNEFRHGFGAEESLPLTQGTPAVY